MDRILSCSLVALIVVPVVLGFSPEWRHQIRKVQAAPIFSAPLIDDLSDDERQAVIFQTLLRDLQIEGVPLLDCDADQAHIMQAAIWTTVAELTDQPDRGKACLILENIPMGALRTWVDDFLIFKTQQDHILHLPELQRVSVSLLGKGVGPALVLEVVEGETASTSSIHNEFACSAAMKVFMDRVVVGNDLPTSIGLGDEGSAPPIVYRFEGAFNVCSVLATFWNCVCEMLSAEDVPGTICLQIPSYSSNFAKFDAATTLMARTLCLYQGEALLSLFHFHPQYDRSLVTPVEKPAFGHLPPISWMGPMLKAFGDADKWSEEDLSLTNFQSKSPIAAVNILRNSLLSEPKIIEIELDDGSKTLASGLEVYCANTIKLAKIGVDPLKAAHDYEVNVAKKK